MPEPLVILLVAVAAIAAVAGAIAWRAAFLFALPALTVLNGLPIPVGAASSVRVDQLAALALAVPLAVGAITRARPLRTDAATWWLAAILAMNVAATLLNSPVRGYSMAQCANLAATWVVYVVLLNGIDSRRTLMRFVTMCVWVAVITCAVGIVAYALAVAGVGIGGADVSREAAEQGVTPYGAYGTMLEPNIFGSYTAAALVLAIGLLGRRDATADGPSPRLLRTLAVLAAAGLVVSFTRAAWLGAIAGGVFLLLTGPRVLGERWRGRRPLVPLAAGSAVMLGLVVITGNAGAVLRFKVANIVNFASATAALRIATYLVALEQYVAHPIVGWGTFTFAPILAEGGDFQRFEGWRNLWIGNFLLLALHDTGVIGLCLWIGLLVTVLRRGVASARAMRDADPDLAHLALVLTGAVASLLIPYLATSGFSLGYSWLLIGTLGACCRLAREPASAAPSDGVPRTAA